MENKMRKSFITIFIVLLIIILIIIFGYKTKSKELKAMIESPIANLQLNTAQEVKRSYKDKDVTFGKPIHAGIRIEYEPIDNYTKEDVYNEIVENIESSGWKRNYYNVGQRDYYSASLPHGSFSLAVQVFNHPDTNTVRVVIGYRARQRQ